MDIQPNIQFVSSCGIWTNCIFHWLPIFMMFGKRTVFSPKIMALEMDRFHRLSDSVTLGPCHTFAHSNSLRVANAHMCLWGISGSYAVIRRPPGIHPISVWAGYIGCTYIVYFQHRYLANADVLPELAPFVLWLGGTLYLFLTYEKRTGKTHRQGTIEIWYKYDGSSRL